MLPTPLSSSYTQRVRMLGHRGLTSERIHELALKSIEALVSRGWHRRAMVSHEGSVCAQGAMFCALGVDPMRIMRYGMAATPNVRETYVEFELMNEQFQQAVGMDTVKFNDRWATGVDSVIKAFQRIADATAPVEPKIQTDHELAGGPQ